MLYAPSTTANRSGSTVTGGSKVTEALLKSAGELLDEAERYRSGI